MRDCSCGKPLAAQMHCCVSSPPSLTEVQEGNRSAQVSLLMEMRLRLDQLNTYPWSISIDYFLPFGNGVTHIFSR